MICSRCKKRMAVLFISKMEGDKAVNEGLCLKCAKELGIPQVNSLMEQMGLTDEDIEKMSDQMSDFMDGDSFEMGGMDTMPPFLQNMFGGGNINSDAEDADPSSTYAISEEAEKAGGGKKKDAKKNQKNEPKRKFLTSYCTNLTARAARGELDEVIGRDSEIYRVIQILSRRSKNNPCLIGEPGVGKTAIAEGIAQRIVKGEVPFRLQDKELYLLDMTALVAGTQFRGQFESRVKGLIDEVKRAGNIILFIDEIHTIVGTGDSEGSMSAANILKPALSRGEIQVIGATTFNEYRKNIEKDSALERRFQPVKVQEPSLEDTLKVIMGVKKYYEAHHKVKVSEYIAHLAVTMSERYITDRYLPDKAIDLLDEACSCCSIRNADLTEYEKLTKQLKTLLDQEEELEADPEAIDYEKIAKAKADIIVVKEKLKEIEPRIANIEVEVSDIARVIELWTGIPAAKIQENEYKKLATLDDRLKEKIIGQDEAIHAVSNAIRRSRVQLSKVKRPASFIFVGPTGVGKTQLVKVLSEELFDSVEPLIRLDMTEYMEKHSVSKLIGSPPGYVGYDEAGQLTEKVRRKPYSVILFDEIEKAHPDVLNILLQILDEGRVTDAQGRTVNFENTVIAMTSNAGSSDKSGIVGFNRSVDELAKEKAMKALGEFLRPEFLGRVDEIIVFHALTEENLKQITGLMLDELKEPLSDKGISFRYDDSALKAVTTLAEGGKFAARDLRKVIRREVEDKVANLLIEHFEHPPKVLSLSADSDNLKLDFSNEAE
ncbi:ATP-dependent Clp protease ATP-binding subunit ClpC [uncultured Ruminococcus sp.]|uniref:ATP-dependent Clp protease ATP-binding subunit n=1 Tax=Massiliimalia timonensis TaxID=1987501 RepID=A0A8J6TWI7_9FIRM|nr:ATP-dependent Clp protease ATP-binding subunit [Massiliimalia timonensis]MBC8609805.1 ATP-dependent Clp protease ATP-binding subunit [Massiliimalia timonensis]SCH24580.1 ATP-dependent Clp protease ATP-binding subunit ClpC [uncultured Ruminococcus sp.]SCH29358.1 ATP-dependent Clp protease ATP-binding subunit ClpC [uncultured Clostridium sp.]